MNPLLAAAAEIEQFCHERSWRYCFIGGLAVQRWGEPRLTQDADLTVVTGFGNEEPYIEAVLASFEARRDDAADFARRYRVILVRASSGAPIDISLGAMPFEERAVERASQFRMADGVILTTCSAEDLVVYKAFAGRPQDWFDIEGIALRQGGKLDRQLILIEAEPLLELKDAPEDLVRLRELLAREQTGA